MDIDELAEHRKKRLMDLLATFYGGNRTACGNALGYAGGAPIRQFLTDVRPITEKTIARWTREKRIPNGWFADTSTGPANAAPSPDTESQSMLGDIERLPADVQQLVIAYMDLLPEDKVAMAAPILEQGAKAKRYRERAQEALGNKGSFPEGKMGAGWSAADKPPPIPPKKPATKKAAKKQHGGK